MQDVRVPEKELAEKEGVSGNVRDRRRKRRVAGENAVVDARAAPAAVAPAPAPAPAAPTTDAPPATSVSARSFYGVMPTDPSLDEDELEEEREQELEAVEAGKREAVTEQGEDVHVDESMPNKEHNAAVAARVGVKAVAEEEEDVWPKKVNVSVDDFMTKKEHNEVEAAVKVEAARVERVTAFARLAFSRKERAKAARHPDVLGDVQPSDGPVAAAVPAAVSRQDLLTLEERVSRIERILIAHNIGEDQWLNEG